MREEKKTLVKRLVAACLLFGGVAVIAAGTYEVRESNATVILKFGKIVDRQPSPGWHFYFPKIYKIYSERIGGHLTYFNHVNPYINRESESKYHYNAIISWEIEDPERYLTATSMHAPIANDRLSIRGHTELNKILTNKSVDLIDDEAVRLVENELTEQLKKMGSKELGIKVLEAKILSINGVSNN